MSSECSRAIVWSAHDFGIPSRVSEGPITISEITVSVKLISVTIILIIIEMTKIPIVIFPYYLILLRLTPSTVFIPKPIMSTTISDIHTRTRTIIEVTVIISVIDTEIISITAPVYRAIEILSSKISIILPI
jgi:hypothetical protein